MIACDHERAEWNHRTHELVCLRCGLVLETEIFGNEFTDNEVFERGWTFNHCKFREDLRGAPARCRKTYSRIGYLQSGAELKRTPRERMFSRMKTTLNGYPKGSDLHLSLTDAFGRYSRLKCPSFGVETLTDAVTYDYWLKTFSSPPDDADKAYRAYWKVVSAVPSFFSETTVEDLAADLCNLRIRGLRRYRSRAERIMDIVGEPPNVDDVKTFVLGAFAAAVAMDPGEVKQKEIFSLASSPSHARAVLAYIMRTYDSKVEKEYRTDRP